MDPAIKVLHILVGLGSGGVESLLLNLADRLPPQIRFDYLVDHPDCRDREAVDAGSLVHYVPSGERSPLRYIDYAAKLLDRHRYDVVHFHRIAFGGALMKKAERIGVPVRIAHCHASTFQEPGVLKKSIYYPYHWVLNRRLLNRHATHIFGVSGDSLEFLMGTNWRRRKKCRTLFNGISLKDFVSRATRSSRKELGERYGIPSDAVVIGTFGRLTPIKNQAFLLRVFAELAARRGEYRLFIGGTGELEHSLKTRADDLGLGDRVLMPGYCDNVPELSANLFDTFCLPSLREGFGLSLVETTAAGLHSTCSRAVPEDLTGRFPGRITPLALSAPPSVWAEALERGIREKIPMERGIELVRNSPFTLQSMLDVLVPIYFTAARRP